MSTYWIFKDIEGDEYLPMDNKKKLNISAFLDDTGKITQIPVPNKTKIPVLAYLGSKFDKDRFC